MMTLGELLKLELEARKTTKKKAKKEGKVVPAPPGPSVYPKT
jgi:hypothetical protein